MLRRIVSMVTFSVMLAGSLLAWGDVEIKDPAGDDNGPGSYKYPTHAVYKKGSFDILSLVIKDAGSDVEFHVTVDSSIDDPWKSKEWGGNGFSLQFVQVYIDSKAKAGHCKALPGLNVAFDDDACWDKVVLISPQGKSRLTSEVKSKAKDVVADVVIPKTTRVKGKTLVSIVSKADLGGAPAASWGYQALMQSNEGYPDKGDLLTRKVNEYEGEHRFGGGTDYDCDPHAIDIIMPPGKGGADEKEAQYKALKGYKCGDKEADWVLTKVPMVYPGK